MIIAEKTEDVLLLVAVGVLPEDFDLSPRRLMELRDRGLVESHNGSFRLTADGKVEAMCSLCRRMSE